MQGHTLMGRSQRAVAKLGHLQHCHILAMRHCLTKEIYPCPAPPELTKAWRASECLYVADYHVQKYRCAFHYILQEVAKGTGTYIIRQKQTNNGLTGIIQSGKTKQNGQRKFSTCEC